MTKLSVAWAVLISFSSQVALAGTPATPANINTDKVLTLLTARYQGFKSFKQVKDPVIKALIMAEKLRDTQIPKLKREGDVLMLEAGEHKVPLEFTDFEAKKIKVNNKELHLKSFGAKDVAAAVKDAITTTHTSIYDFLVPDAQAMDPELAAGLFIIVVAFCVFGGMAYADYKLNNTPAPPMNNPLGF